MNMISVKSTRCLHLQNKQKNDNDHYYDQTKVVVVLITEELTMLTFHN